MRTRFAPLAAGLALLAALPLPAMADDESQYMLNCGGCHLRDGQGFPERAIPPFQGIIGNILKHPEGRKYIVNTGGSRSAGIDHATRAAILNWIVQAWGGEDAASFEPFTEAEVERLHAAWRGDSTKLREAIQKDLRENGIEIAPVYPWAVETAER